jgi:hypothetical protein
LQFLPIVLATFQMTLMMTKFKFDTPVIMKCNNEIENLESFMNMLYLNWECVDEKITEIGGGDGQEEESITFSQAFCDPNYKNATWMGITLAMG